MHFTTVAKLLRGLGYSLQANAKTREGSAHPDRDAQFRHINDTVKAALGCEQPVISVDTKRRSSSGTSKTAGASCARRAHRCGQGPRLPRSRTRQGDPYGIYGLAEDSGWVNVGIDHDTAQFAVASIRGWWEQLGSQRCPDANTLTITADCGRSNGYRTRLWKTELQPSGPRHRPADPRLALPARHDKWNRIEHRLLSFITQTGAASRSRAPGDRQPDSPRRAPAPA